jgi:hypothetical protein
MQEAREWKWCRHAQQETTLGQFTSVQTATDLHCQQAATQGQVPMLQQPEPCILQDLNLSAKDLYAAWHEHDDSPLDCRIAQCHFCAGGQIDVQSWDCAQLHCPDTSGACMAYNYESLEGYALHSS